MEVFSVGTGKVKEVNRPNAIWYAHEFALVDWHKTGLLEKLEESINDIYQQAIFKAVEKMSVQNYAGENRSGYCKWFEQKEPPFDSYECKQYYFLAFKKLNYYCTQDGLVVLDEMDLHTKIIKAVNEILYRNDNLDEKEFECMKWMFMKMGMKIKVEGDTAA